MEPMERWLLRVDLTGGGSRREAAPAEVARNFIGGRGFAAHYLFSLPPGSDPLGPENKLALAAGPLAGSGARGTGRWLAAAKSPLSGGYIRSVGGGDFGPWLRASGYELLILEGKANAPVYLYLNRQGEADLLPAQDLWGRGTQATQEILRERHGKNCRIACIGPAGEKMVRFAAVISGESAAGRGGTGAVMGSKNLKAVVVDAEPETFSPARPEKFQDALRRQHEAIEQGRFVSPGVTTPVQLAAKNFRDRRQNPAAAAAGGPGRGEPRRNKNGGPELQTYWALGINLLHAGRDFVTALNRLGNDLGLDTVSTGGTIAFAYELQEKGIWRADPAGPGWGRPEATRELMKIIAFREGLGDLLAEGTVRAAQKIGAGAQECAMAAGGIEMPGYDPRFSPAYALHLLTSSLGGSFCAGGVTEPVLWPEAENGDLVGRVIANQDGLAALETGVGDLFAALSGWLPPAILASLLTAATGEEAFAEPALLRQAGARIHSLERLFNLRENLPDTALPERFRRELPAEEGLPPETAGASLAAGPEALLPEYYRRRGWDNRGRPTAATLKKLGLEITKTLLPEEMFHVAFSAELT